MAYGVITPEDRMWAVHSILKRSERNRRYCQGHREEMAELNRLYYRGHKGEVAEYHCRRWQEHKEEIAEYHRRYYQEHPEAMRNAFNRRRARLAGADGSFTDEEFRVLCEIYGNRCGYCHQELPLVPDHAIPLSRGGGNSIDNIVPACRSCNNEKYTMTYGEFLLRRKVQSGL